MSESKVSLLEKVKDENQGNWLIQIQQANGCKNGNRDDDDDDVMMTRAQFSTKNFAKFRG